MTAPTRNKKIAAGIGVAAVAAAAIAIGAGTFAAFNDTETGPSGTLATGTLDLTVDAAPTTTPVFTATDIAPGFTSDAYTLTYRNAGSIPGALSLTLGVTNKENGCNEPEAIVDQSCNSADGELGGALLITVNGPNLTYSGTLNGLAGGPTPVGVLAPGASAQYSVQYTLPIGVGNEVQSDGVEVAASAALAQ